MAVMRNAIVRGLSRGSARGKLHLGNMQLPCALGRGGRRAKHGEGDGITPIGRWALRHVFYRPDRLARPRTALTVSPLHPGLGWCDEPGDANYNRIVPLPYPCGHERLWREDNLYDLVTVLGYNDRPRSQWRGSAIFMHLARSGYQPTEGCIALSRADMQHFLAAVGGHDVVIIE
jgi:L,D-peptidoglycan transpeptidase YkuD (ErfK/YbiS/YcfS/YnhG family)